MTDVITSVPEFTEAILRDVHAWKTVEEYIDFPWMPWFRGEPVSATPLLPKLYRDGTRPRYIETELLHHFRRMAALPDLGQTPDSKAIADWLFLARHSGVPTRLLDWTEGALVALYFALREPKESVVWMLQPLTLNAESELSAFDVPSHPPHRSAANVRAAWQDDRDDRQSAVPIAIYPTHVHTRLRVQKSCFTLHGTDKRGIDAIIKDAGIDRFLKRYALSPPHKESMLASLEVLGVSHATLFPDLDGLAEELGRRFMRSPIISKYESE